MRRAVAVCSLAVALGACGSDPPALPAACRGEPRELVAALARAPGEVRLRDGTRLSRCVDAADSTAELQTLGVAFAEAAERLRDRRAAVALGYLVGATRKGAAQTPGVAAELAVRIGRVAGRMLDDAPELRDDLAAGRRAGERLG